MSDRRIKIVSDGTPAGTAVVDAETGAPISGVMAVSWRADVVGVTATLEIERVEIEAVGECR